MQLLGREANWDRLANSVIIYASQGRLPDEFLPFAEHDEEGKHIVQYDVFTHKALTEDGKRWRVVASPLFDASGKEVGDLLVMKDITTLTANLNRNARIVGLIGALILGTTLAFVFVILRRADIDFQSQANKLKQEPAPRQCPVCGSEKIRWRGFGTQKGGRGQSKNS